MSLLFERERLETTLGSEERRLCINGSMTCLYLLWVKSASYRLDRALFSRRSTPNDSQETLDGLCEVRSLADVFRTAFMRLSASSIIVLTGFLLQAGAVRSCAGDSRLSSSLLEQESVQWALAQIESGHFKNPDTTQGPSGEVSRFQIMPGVWKDYSRSKKYSDPNVAWRVAHRILQDRQGWFVTATGRLPSPFDLYIMWNKPGLYDRLDFNRKRLPHRLRDVAERFENLVLEMSQLKLTSK